MSEFVVKALDESTWPNFVRLVEKHNGVWGGCWCLWFHNKGGGDHEHNRGVKHELVCEGRAKAALVFDGDNAVGWCQFGKPDDLVRVKHMKQYALDVKDVPDWRITCFFVDRDYRRKGVAALALQGALDLIAREGGGLVESFPAQMDGRKTSASFLYNATITLFDRHGFQRVAKIGMHHWLVTQTVAPAEG